MSTCVAIITSVHSDPQRQGKPCGRAAKFTDEKGRPVCAYHRPEHLAKLRARNPFVTPYAALRGGYASAKKRWGFQPRDDFDGAEPMPDEALIAAVSAMGRREER